MIERTPIVRADVLPGCGAVPRVACLVVFGALFLGCPSGAGNSGSGGAGSTGVDGANSVSGKQDFRICDAHLAWDKRCAAEDPASHGEPFWGETECRTSPWRYLLPDYVEATVDCFGSLPCKSSDDTCTSAGLMAIGLDPSGDPPADPLYERCVGTPPCEGFIDDVCLAFLVRTDAGRRVTEPCLDLACSSIASCVSDPDAFASK